TTWRRAACRSALVAAAVILLGTQPLAGAGLGSAIWPSRHSSTEVRSVRCGGHDYQYVLSVPGGSRSKPALLLLHGAGGVARDFVDAWQPLATSKGVVLIAPQLPRELWFEAVAPAAFRCIIADARQHAFIDPARIYLFGYSMGGYLAFDGALLAPDAFAAVAVYGAAIAPDYESLIGGAARRIPTAIYIGTRDQFYPLTMVRRTRDLLQAAGFTVHYVEFANQNHAYAPVADRLQRDAWAFLSAYRLPGDSLRRGH
ncbi:MAG: alpha/beta fold hydrolase, partial [Gemmatimonadales bacterium]